MINLIYLIQQVLNTKYSALFISNLLLQDSKMYFYNGFEPEIINIKNLSDFDKVEQKIKDNKYGYLKLDYEFGNHIYNFSKDNIGYNIAVFSDINNWQIIKSNEIDFQKLDEYSTNIELNGELQISKENYLKKILLIKNEIENGNTYQINFTTKLKFNYDFKIIDLIISLLKQQSTDYTAILNLGENLIISFSPELFLKIVGNKIKSSPMKGTLKRGINIGNDIKNEKKLFNSKKNRAENIMIVDLIRNDLGKICEIGTIKVGELFKIEKYETLFQMISTVEGELKKNIKLKEIIANTFPCGSITGAPKKSSMEIIKKLENENRGIYTGTIGLLLNDKKVFNIAIRTFDIKLKNKNGEIGLGSGITYRSNPINEYKEVVLKAKFIKKDEFFLLETILLDNGKYFLLNEHINRLEESAKFFLFKFEREKLLDKLKNLAKNYNEGEFKVRILLSKFGTIIVKINQIDYFKKELDVVVYNKKINTQKPEFYFKTTKREIYNKAFEFAKSKNYDEAIIINKNNEITEGTFTNIFYKIDEQWFTPSLHSGLLNGVYRKFLIKKRGIIEKKTTLEDLRKSSSIILTNSVRKEIKVHQVIYDNEIIYRYD